MKNRFTGKTHTILVGTLFNQEMERLVIHAHKLAKLSDQKVRLTHVCKPWAGRTWMTAYGEEAHAPVVAHLTEEYMLREAKKRIGELESSIMNEIEIDSNVLLGSPSECLSADAKSCRASLIVVSSRHRPYKYLPRGLSTALTLMATSTVPTLVYPKESQSNFPDKDFTVLICDDLHESGESAILTAREFCEAFGAAKVAILHVCSISQSQIDKYVELLDDAMQVGLIEADSSYSTETAYRNLEARITSTLTERSRFIAAESSKRGAEFERIVKFGSPEQEIIDTARNINADILVFGRHETNIKRPFAVGRVPFSAMLGTDKPVLVIPPLKRN